LSYIIHSHVVGGIVVSHIQSQVVSQQLHAHPQLWLFIKLSHLSKQSLPKPYSLIYFAFELYGWEWRITQGFVTHLKPA
jgi:hypothetical protein